MKITVTETKQVEVNPRDVIVQLLRVAKEPSNNIFEKDNKYYKELEYSAGSHAFFSSKEITKEEYDYIKALETILNYLK